MIRSFDASEQYATRCLSLFGDCKSRDAIDVSDLLAVEACDDFAFSGVLGCQGHRLDVLRTGFDLPTSDKFTLSFW